MVSSISLLSVLVVLEIAGAAVWTFNLPARHYVFWSMGLTVVAAAIFLLCGILMIPDIRKFDYDYIQLKKQLRKEKKKKRKQLMQNKH